MRVEIIEGPDNFKVYNGLKGVNKKVKQATRKGMFKWAKDLKSTASAAILAKDKTGRIYIRRDAAGRRRRHRASSAGESHANRTGALRRSIGWRVTAWDRLLFGYGVDGKDTPDYDGFVEFGTFKMKPRPSIQNSINNTLGNAETYFKGELDKLNEI